MRQLINLPQLLCLISTLSSFLPAGVKGAVVCFNHAHAASPAGRQDFAVRRCIKVTQLFAREVFGGCDVPTIMSTNQQKQQSKIQSKVMKDGGGVSIGAPPGPPPSLSSQWINKVEEALPSASPSVWIKPSLLSAVFI